MVKHRFLSKAASFIGFFFIIFIISACNLPGSNSSQAGDLTPVDQRFVNIPGGLMLLGDGDGINHPVLLYDYQIQSRFVTQDEYINCVAAGGCQPAEESAGGSAPAAVNWYQAQAYCEYLGGRLPTEAELNKVTQTDQSCPNPDYGVSPLQGFGEWVYDWDDPDYYNQSLVTNPFGPLYGDLKLVLGLDLDQLPDIFVKYEHKVEDSVIYAKVDGQAYKIETSASGYKIEHKVGGSELKVKEVEFKSRDADDNFGFFPRIGMLPDVYNPLVGFRCVSGGTNLAYAPFSKQSYAAYCSLPSEGLQAPDQLLSSETINPNFNIAAASCPDNGRVNITIDHDLPSGAGIDVNDPQSPCECQEYPDFPGRLYCSCTSPGEGNYLNVEVCESSSPSLIFMNDYCPEGYLFDSQTISCAPDSQAPVQILSWDANPADQASAENPVCPSDTSLAPSAEGYFGLTAAMVDGLSENGLPEGDDWTLYSISDGSGMCPPGYYFNPKTHSCSPFSEENYGCGEGQYFDAGVKQCLSIQADGCGPCQVFDALAGCVPGGTYDIVSERCNIDDHEIEPDEYGRPDDGSGPCGPTAYLDLGLDRCVETEDGCPVGYYLDPLTGTCTPVSGPKGPCPLGNTYSPDIGCCVPSPGDPGDGGSECPAGTAFDGLSCSPVDGGCPPSHYYDGESDSCLLRESGVCPSGTTENLIGKCIPEMPEQCPPGTEYEPRSGSCPTTQPDPPICPGDQVFDNSFGFCPPLGTHSGMGGGSGKCDVQDIDEVDTIERPENLELSCASGLMPMSTVMATNEGLLQCLILSADKTFQSGTGLCSPAANGDPESEHFYTIKFEAGRISSIDRVTPDEFEPASAEAPDQDSECPAGFIKNPDDYCLPQDVPCGALFLNFAEAKAYQSSCDTGDPSADPDTGGEFPPIYVEGFSFFANCSSLQIGTPSCSAGQSGGSTNKCAGIGDWGTCDNTAGCHWVINEIKCVPD